MNAEDILFWVIQNLLTEEQLDARLPTGKTIRQWAANRKKERGQ